MTVLILEEYRDLSEEELKKIIREEAQKIKEGVQKMFDPDSFKDILGQNFYQRD